jgi:hypothetical protein
MTPVCFISALCVSFSCLIELQGVVGPSEYLYDVHNYCAKYDLMRVDVIVWHAKDNFMLKLILGSVH